MKQEGKFIYIGCLATGQTDYVRNYYGKNRIFNLQLRYWAEALEKFQMIDKGNFILEETLLIINYLCSSLETLAGVNINPVEWTPPLMKMYEKTLKNDKGWDLKSEQIDLFEKLKEMDNYHKNICKHINKSEFKREMLKEIDYAKIKEYMKVTQGIWLWLLDKNYNGKIPKSQLEFFRNSF